MTCSSETLPNFEMFRWNISESATIYEKCVMIYNKSWTFSIKKDVHRISYMVINKTYEIAQSILLSIKREGESGKAAAVFGFFF